MSKIKIRHREEQLLRALRVSSYTDAVRMKQEWLSLPTFIRKNATFSIYLENILSNQKEMR